MLLTCVALLQGSSKVPEQRVMGTTLVRELCSRRRETSALQSLFSVPEYSRNQESRRQGAGRTQGGTLEAFLMLPTS